MMEENLKNEEMERKPEKGGTGVRARKVIALILLFVFSFIFTLGGIGTVAVFASGATLGEALDGDDYYELSNSQRYVHDVASSLIYEDISQDSIWLDGSYDENQTVDITNLRGGILVTDKNPATTYKLKDLVTMYEASVDGRLQDVIAGSEDVADNPEIIMYLQENYGADEFLVDNLGNLYIVVSDADAWETTPYVNALLTGTVDNVDPMEAFGCVFYSVIGDQVELCTSLPDGFEAMDVVSWSEFSARYMLDISGLTEREQTDFNYGDYGDQFQYLYKYGMEVETLLPESGEKLAVYALKNPATVSIYDLYKQLATAIEEVGSAVVNEEYDNAANEVSEPVPTVLYWVKDLASETVWTNNPRWDVQDVEDVQSEIINYDEANSEGGYYPYYLGRECHANTSSNSGEELFFSTDDVYFEVVESVLYDHYGMSDIQYVVAVNPMVVTSAGAYEMGQSYYYNVYSYQNVYEMHAPYTVIYLLMTVVGGVGAVICAVISVVMAGRRDKTKNRYAAPLAKNTPIELLLLLFVGCWIGYAVYFFLYFYDGFLGWNYGTTLSDYVGIIIAVMGFIALATWQILALVTKGKSKNMRRNSLIGRAGNGLKKTSEASGFTRKCPIEVMLALFLVIWIIFIVIMGNVISNSYGGFAELLSVIILFAGIAILAYWQISTLVHKGKSGNMTTNSLVKRFGGAVVSGCKNAYRNRKVTGKLMILSIVFCVVNLIFIGLSHATYITPVWIFLLIVLWIVTIVLLMKKCMQKQRLKEGIHEIAGGNMEYQIRMDKLSGDELDMAWDLNNIQSGMENAVERMMKSERMKTDLITNVSHDLKTPLTSIINYVDILKKEDIQDPKIRGYIEILEQKSLRLKNLTEDLMEAAKISSGNITLELQNINLKQLLYQTNGEFEEKFAKRNLQLVCTLPDSDVYINADGRRMWRVIENLYNNAAKYAQPHSRVYVDGKLQAGKVELVIKNVSEAPLNISADELMERFVRGDVARNTEGSGLGLEIARNLTVMQKGTFDIQLDGDLFKVILTFDAV